jgi:glycerol-3-phosphate O-acyltransferase
MMQIPIKRKFKEWISSKLIGVHNHFSCYLPPRLGLFFQVILDFLFSGIKIPTFKTSLIQQPEKTNIIIFVNKYKSYFEFLFYHIRYRKEKFLYPTIGFDYQFFIWQPAPRFFKIFFSHLNHFLKYLSFPNPYKSGYIHEKLLNGESALLSLVEEKGFARRFIKSKADPLHYLIEMQKTIDRPIVFYPQLMLFDKTPETTQLSLIDIIFGTKENPGRLRRLFNLFKRPNRIFIEASDPVRLEDFINQPSVRNLNPKDQAMALRRYLITQINRHRQSITGPTLKSNLEIKEELLTNPDIQQIIMDYAAENNVSIYQAQQQAADYLDEISSNMSMKIIRVLDVSLRWAFNNIFEGMVIDTAGLERVKKISQKSPLILVPCHKSHLDYLILSYVFYNNNMPCPHIAAGKNLSFWPLGPIFRGGGAFFLRRSFKGEVLYPKIFAAYIQKILEEGFHIEFFVEGGRSRSGKLLSPKIGFLSLVIDAYIKTKSDDMFFVPIYIGYDRVLEEKSYIHELEGGKKTPENLINVIKARKFLSKKYGKIYLNFHEPISLNQHLSKIDRPLVELSKNETKELYTQFAYKLVSAINRVTVATPHAIIASVVLNSSQKRIYRNQLLAHAEIYMANLVSQNASLADTLLIDRGIAFDNVLESFVQNKFIEKSASEYSSSTQFNPLFKINENRRPSLEYYKNSSVIFFIPAAFTAFSILKNDAFQFSATDLHATYKFLTEFFENEFIFDYEHSVEYVVRKNIKAFIDDAIIMPHPTLPDTYNLTAAGFRKLNLFAAFLSPYFESYWVVLSFFMKYTKQPILEIKDHMNKIQSLGNRMYKRKEIERIEALSKMNYQNAVTFFTNHGITDPEKDKEKIEFYADVFQQYRRYLPR